MSRPIISLGGKAIGERDERSYFLVVEGLDGSGKTTQGTLIGDELRNKGREVVMTKEPTATSAIAQKLADALAKKIKVEPRELQELFTRDRKDHVERLIMPILEKGLVVISDRYAFSTLAYGSLHHDEKWLKELNAHFPLPDLTLFFDVEPNECLQRIGHRGKPQELFEEKKKLEKIRNAYLKISKEFPLHFKVIDGNGTIEETHAKAMFEVNRLIS
ncbi:MAG: dTMP kinase [Nanoarchaeota archaeon]|nr:dTMP kinase [Nanoarchaeota archaeon]